MLPCGLGITPAWAGKSSTLTKSFPAIQDHPRVGGEKCIEVCPVVVLQGSPPRGRGKEIVDVTEWPTNRITPAWAGKAPMNFLKLSQMRITPAWAGKRAVDTVNRYEHWDHPRVGGEKGRAVLGPVLGTGSPPRGRGKGITTMTFELYARITPAWAGKSSTCCCASIGGTDHPRVGGEKPAGHTAAVKHPRITPAWAGKR